MTSARRRWARCNACGEEVVFDAWVTLDGQVESQFDENYCTGCDGRVGSAWTTVEN